MPLPSRKFEQSPFSQGSNELIAYNIDFTKWSPHATPITNPTATLIDVTNGNIDVTATKMVGAASILGNVVTTPLVVGLVPGVEYRMNVYVDIDGNTFEAWGTIIAEL